MAAPEPPAAVPGATWIALSQNQSTLVDDADLERVAQHRWHLKVQRKNPGKYYAQTTVSVGGKKTSIQLHRFLVNAPDGVFVDHRDGNPLNNRRDNLRLCTNRQNQENVVHSKNQKRGGYKGVNWNRNAQKWEAGIAAGERRSDGKRRRLYLGLFVDPKDAARAYDAAALKHFGEFAALNFPTDELRRIARGA